jgi:O-succinylbenzoate synthase
MSSVEDKEMTGLSMEAKTWSEELERKLQDDIDTLIDFMAIASIMWEQGYPDIALELAACARIAMDRILEACSSSGAAPVSGGRSWDFIKILGSVGGEALGEVIYWATKARCMPVSSDAEEMLRDFAKFVGIDERGLETEALGDMIVKYISSSLNRAIALLVTSARRAQ